MESANFQHATNINFVFAELLPQILENCTTPELLTLRLVSPQWREEATKLLLKRGSLQIEFKLNLQTLECRKGKHGITFYAFKPGKKISWLCERHFQAELSGNLTRKMEFHKTLPNLFRLMTPPSCASYSSSLPVTHFDFQLQSFMVAYRVEPQLLSFVQNFGPQLRALTLDDYVPFFVGHPGSQSFLLQYTPNLESLRIRFNNYEATLSPSLLPLNVEPIQNTNFTLPALKFIEILGPYERETSKILVHLLEIAPQLERVSFPELYELTVLQDFPPDKIHLLYITALTLRERELFLDDLRNLECLVTAMTSWIRDRPQGTGLKRLQIIARPVRDNMQRGIRALLKIFQLNANSLEKVELWEGAALILHKIPGFPALPKVTQLVVKICSGSYHDDDDDDDGNSPHRGNSLAAMFPNLEEVQLGVLQCETDHGNRDLEYGSLFPFWNEKLNQVKTCRADFFSAPENLGINDAGNNRNNIYAKILNFCPQATNLSMRLSRPDNVPVKMKPLWNLSQLTTLHLKCDLFYSHGNCDDFLDWDAALTGFSKATVCDLYKSWQRGGEWEERTAEGLQGSLSLSRVNSSLLSLTNLKNLQLDFEMGYTVEPRVMISCISAQFAFALMPNLEVFVNIKQSNGGARCPVCLQQGIGEKEKWLELHRPLLSFPRVNLAFYQE